MQAANDPRFWILIEPLLFQQSKSGLSERTNIPQTNR